MSEQLINGAPFAVLFERERRVRKKTIDGAKIESVSWTSPPVGLVQVGDWLDFFSYGAAYTARVVAVVGRSAFRVQRPGVAQTMPCKRDNVALVRRLTNPLDAFAQGLP